MACLSIVEVPYLRDGVPIVEVPYLRDGVSIVEVTLDDAASILLCRHFVGGLAAVVLYLRGVLTVQVISARRSRCAGSSVAASWFKGSVLLTFGRGASSSEVPVVAVAQPADVTRHPRSSLVEVSALGSKETGRHCTLRTGAAFLPL